jgi:uncharacterized protein with PIN domain
MAEKIKFYFDEHMSRPLARAVREKGCEVMMAIELGMEGKDDDTEHLPLATEKGAVLFTRDKPFAGRTMKQTDHAGLVCWTGKDDDVGGMVRALVEFAETYTMDDVKGTVFWLK